MRQPESPWVCPECGYAPEPFSNRGYLFYKVLDARKRCPKYAEQIQQARELYCNPPGKVA
jgi:hypothetical protein